VAIFLLDVEREGVVPAVFPKWRPSIRREWVVGALACIVFATTIGLVAVNETQTNTDFDQTHYSLSLIQHRIDSISADLVTIRHDLSVVKGQVGTDSVAQATDTAQLEKVQGVLASAQANVSHQSSLIGDLQSCLDGVEQASNALAVGDQSGAIDALDAVSLSCANSATSNG
jgi:hypothetical protein